ncbi:RAMP superfamily CRISPR-associated protein [Algivirga pacifica]|uniref:CRISPR type III-associated protein domain-containing protein n=1 Tax=Algivirga pacifica TaxID=1162670 RepID=A0ABP9D830_9BACT
MGKITYDIQFYADWHAGSGLSAGMESDSTCLKDSNGLPFLPGRTTKGLLRTEGERLCALGKYSDELLTWVFGAGENKDKGVTGKQGKVFFTDASLPKSEQKALKGKETYLYRNIASTAIDKSTGVAKEGSLRVMEVTVPLKLEGVIYVEQEKELVREFLHDCLRGVKLLGANRHRGLGRCEFKLKN